MRDDEAGSQSARDAAMVLPFGAAVLLLPPVILVFATPAAPAGIPLIVVYVLAVWAAVILAAFLLARRLGGAPRRPGPHDAG